MAGHDPATPFGRNIIEYQGHTVVMARRYVEAEFNRQNVGSALKLGAMKGGFELTQDFEGTTCEDILAYWGKKIGMQGLAALATKMFGMGMVAAYNAVDIAINNEDYRAAMLQLLSEVRTMSEIAGTDPISAIYNAAKGGPDALVKLIEMGIYYKISTTIENTINGTPKPSNTAPKKQPNPSQNPPKPPPPAGGSGKLQPNLSAEGSHTTLKVDPQTGKVTHYETWQPQSNPRNPNPWESVKRYDATGGAHYNKATKVDVVTPHVHDPATPGGVRAPLPEEMPE